MTPADLAGMLELLAQGLRALPAAPPGMPTPTAVPPLQCTVADWLPTYEQILGERGYHTQTIKNRRANIRRLRDLWGARPIMAIKPHEIAVPLKRLSPSTASRVLAELRDMYVEAIANGEAESNPAAHVKPPKHPGLRERLTLDTWQAMRLLSKASPQRWVESLLLLAIATGQRRADLAKMRFDDIVTDAAGQKYLRVEQQKKAGKPIGARVEIPLSLQMAAIAMTVGDVIEHCRASAKPGATLLRKEGGGPIEMSSLSARFHEHIVTVKGRNAYARFSWPSLHEARSLSGRTYITQGLTREQVQTLLGHKHAEMTDMYLDDRGLSAGQWKRVSTQSPQRSATTEP
jgi:enterobacteria phage integrase